MYWGGSLPRSLAATATGSLPLGKTLAVPSLKDREKETERDREGDTTGHQRRHKETEKETREREMDRQRDTRLYAFRDTLLPLLLLLLLLLQHRVFAAAFP